MECVFAGGRFWRVSSTDKLLFLLGCISMCSLVDGKNPVSVHFDNVLFLTGLALICKVCSRLTSYKYYAKYMFLLLVKSILSSQLYCEVSSQLYVFNKFGTLVAICLSDSVL